MSQGCVCPHLVSSPCPTQSPSLRARSNLPSPSTQRWGHSAGGRNNYLGAWGRGTPTVDAQGRVPGRRDDIGSPGVAMSAWAAPRLRRTGLAVQSELRPSLAATNWRWMERPEARGQVPWPGQGTKVWQRTRVEEHGQSWGLRLERPRTPAAPRGHAAGQALPPHPLPMVQRPGRKV